MAETLKALGFAIAQTGTGVAMGALVEGVCNSIPAINKYTDKGRLARALVQFSLGIPALGLGAYLMTGGRYVESPIGESMYIFWFYTSQPDLIAQVTAVEQLVGMKIKSWLNISTSPANAAVGAGDTSGRSTAMAANVRGPATSGAGYSRSLAHVV